MVSSGERTIRFRYLICVLTAGMVFGVLGVPQIGLAGASSVMQSDDGLHPHLLMPDNRLVIGTVQKIDQDSGVMEINIGELEPLVLSLDDAAERGMTSMKRGDKLEIVLLTNGIPIDYHLVGQPEWNRVVRGILLEPACGDHKWALVETTQGNVEPFEIVVDARLKVMDIPVGVPAMFLLSKYNFIIDAAFGDEAALLDTLTQWSKERQRMVHY